jgi:pimeloyl-ACP methyl ester carboxylesterase
MRKGTLTVDRFEIPWAMAGTGSECVICVNGMQQTMAAWGSVVRRLVREDRYRVVLFDFPNQGRAVVRAGSSDVGFMEQVEVVRAVADHVSERPPVNLIGGSWGALLAAAYAAVSPRRVAKLVLASFQARANSRLRDVAERGRTLVATGRGAELGELFIREFAGGTSEAHQAAMRAQFRELPAERLWQMHAQAALLMNATDLGAFVDLGQIAADTLIVNGAADTIVDAADVEGTVGRIPRAELRVVPDVGHFVHFERPETVEIYVDFFNRPTTGSGSTGDPNERASAPQGDVAAARQEHGERTLAFE